jgi:hypothetical protein
MPENRQNGKSSSSKKMGEENQDPPYTEMDRRALGQFGNEAGLVGVIQNSEFEKKIIASHFNPKSRSRLSPGAQIVVQSVDLDGLTTRAANNLDSRNNIWDSHKETDKGYLEQVTRNFDTSTVVTDPKNRGWEIAHTGPGAFKGGKRSRKRRRVMKTKKRRRSTNKRRRK